MGEGRGGFGKEVGRGATKIKYKNTTRKPTTLYAKNKRK